jgi:hypothetical protein
MPALLHVASHRVRCGAAFARQKTNRRYTTPRRPPANQSWVSGSMAEQKQTHRLFPLSLGSCKACLRDCMTRCADKVRWRPEATARHPPSRSIAPQARACQLSRSTSPTQLLTIHIHGPPSMFSTVLERAASLTLVLSFSSCLPFLSFHAPRPSGYLSRVLCPTPPLPFSMTTSRVPRYARCLPSPITAAD